MSSPVRDPDTGELIPGCRNCKHFDQLRMTTCRAFPDGIPFVILSGEVAHIEPFPGDDGIQFEPIEDEDSM